MLAGRLQAPAGLMEMPALSCTNTSSVKSAPSSGAVTAWSVISYIFCIATVQAGAQPSQALGCAPGHSADVHSLVKRADSQTMQLCSVSISLPAEMWRCRAAPAAPLRARARRPPSQGRGAHPRGPPA